MVAITRRAPVADVVVICVLIVGTVVDELIGNGLGSVFVERLCVDYLCSSAAIRCVDGQVRDWRSVV